MRLFLRTVALLAFSGPMLAAAATFKCSVNGQTTYQQAPCATDAKQAVIEHRAPAPKPAASAIPVPSTAPAPTPTRTASPKAAPTVTTPTAELDPPGRETMAREAFRTLIAQDVPAFKTMLCANALQNYTRPGINGHLEKSAKDIASHATEIGEALANRANGVCFDTTERKHIAGKPFRVAARPFALGLGRERDGRACVSGFGFTIRCTSAN